MSSGSSVEFSERRRAPARRRSAPGTTAFVAGDIVTPGHTAFTRMSARPEQLRHLAGLADDHPLGHPVALAARSWAAASLRRRRTSRAAAAGYAAVDEMLTIEPWRCSHKYGTTAFDALMMPMKFTARKSSHVAVSWSNIERGVVHEAVDVTELVDHLSCPSPVICSASVTSAFIVSARRPSASMSSSTVLRLVDALQVDDRDVGALLRHRPRVRGADSLRRTGDDADLVEQPVAHQPSPSTASTALRYRRSVTQPILVHSGRRLTMPRSSSGSPASTSNETA